MEASPVQKVRCPSAKSCRGIPASRGEMVSEGRTGATCMPWRGWMARDARAVTDHGGAAIGAADTTHESVLYPGAGRLDSVAGAGSRGAACRIRCTPPHAAAADRSDACPQDEHVCSDGRDAGTVTVHGGAAIGAADWVRESILCRGAGRLASVACAGGRSRLPYWLDTTAGCGSVKLSRLPEAAEGCPQGEHSWLAAKRDLYAWLGVTCTTNKWFQPKGAYSRGGTRRLPTLPDEGRIGSRWLEPATVLP